MLVNTLPPAWRRPIGATYPERQTTNKLNKTRELLLPDAGERTSSPEPLLLNHLYLDLPKLSALGRAILVRLHWGNHTKRLPNYMVDVRSPCYAYLISSVASGKPVFGCGCYCCYGGNLCSAGKTVLDIDI